MTTTGDHKIDFRISDSGLIFLGVAKRRCAIVGDPLRLAWLAPHPATATLENFAGQALMEPCGADYATSAGNTITYIIFGTLLLPSGNAAGRYSVGTG